MTDDYPIIIRREWISKEEAKKLLPDHPNKVNEFNNKAEIARIAFQHIFDAMKDIQEATLYPIQFCWDECLWVDDEFFNYSDLKEDENG